MFAVIKTGGKQYKVSKGQVLRLEKLASFPGKKVQFNEVLLVSGDKMVVGTPFVKDAGVQAEVIDQIRGPKTNAPENALEGFIRSNKIEKKDLFKKKLKKMSFIFLKQNLKY